MCVFLPMLTMLICCIISTVYFKGCVRGLIGFKNEVELFLLLFGAAVLSSLP